jgi:signal transduction histidine kinase
MTLTREASGALGFLPEVTFEGPVDTVVPDDLGRDILATMRDALSNVARHAGATHVEVLLAADGPEVLLRVTDNGCGLPDVPRAGPGLRSMTSRAEARGGRFGTGPAEGGGTVIEWAVPATH